MTVCKWKIDDDEDVGGCWETDCGQSFVIIEGTPSQNGMRFCCYCGGQLEQSPSGATHDR